MTAEEIIAQCPKIQDYHANTLSYEFYLMPDNWIAIFDITVSGYKRPLIQAQSLQKAKDYCYLREPSLGIMRLC
jgi:hypothetical protein